MTDQPPVNILAIGLRVPQQLDPQGDALKKATDGALSKGLKLSFIQLDLEGKSQDECLIQAREKLSEHKYAAVGIGNGIRGNADMTEAFEGLVNLVVETQPGAKLAFPKLPTDALNAFTRVLRRQ